MSIFRRLVLVVTFLIVGYFAVYAGDGVKLLKDGPANEYNEPAVALVVVGFVSAVGALLWFSALSSQLKGDAQKQAETALKAVVALVCLSFVFGYLATPFKEFGDYPWEWRTRYFFLLLIGFVPMVFLIESVVTDSFKMAVKVLSKKSEVTRPDFPSG